MDKLGEWMNNRPIISVKYPGIGPLKNWWVGKGVVPSSGSAVK